MDKLFFRESKNSGDARNKHRKNRRTHKRARAHGSSYNLTYDSLEPKNLLAQLVWDGEAGDNNWHTALNWDLDLVPVDNDDVTISGTTETILFNQADTVSLASLSSETSLTIQAGSLTSADTTFSPDSTLTVSGATTAFESIGSATVTAVNMLADNGGNILFNDLTSYSNNTGTTENIASIIADGPGSVVDLRGVTTINNGVGERDIIEIQATNGGKVDLRSATRIQTLPGGGASESHINITADGANSEIHLQSLLEYWDASLAAQSTLTAANGGTVVSGELYSLQNIGASSDSPLLSTSRNLIFYHDVSIESQTPIPVSTNLYVYNDGLYVGDLNLDADLELNEGSSLRIDPGATLRLGGDVSIATTSLSMQADGLLVLDADSDAANPQVVEVYQVDDGPDGFNNFSPTYNLRSVQLGETTYVRLSDATDNRGNGLAEALYTDELNIPAGATLDLNGLNAYAVTGTIEGTTLNGSVTLDNFAPTVPSIDGLPGEGVTSPDIITSFTVNFSERLDPTTIVAPGAFVLEMAGADGLFDTEDDESRRANADNHFRRIFYLAGFGYDQWHSIGVRGIPLPYFRIAGSGWERFGWKRRWNGW